MLLKCLLKPDFRINFRVESIIKTGWFMILILGHAIYDLAAIAIRKSRHITGHFPTYPRSFLSTEPEALNSK
jgi:hypothetical protein